MKIKNLVLSSILMIAGGMNAFGTEDTPVAVHTVEPAFDRALNNLGTGEVIIVATINEEGRVVSARIENAHDSVAGRACLKAFRRWRFEPASENGKSVSMQVAQPFVFSNSKKDGKLTASKQTV